VTGDDILTSAEAARALGVDEEWLLARKYKGPCSMRLRDRAVTVVRRDLVEWARMRDAERVERREPPEPTLEQRDAMARMRGAAREFGEPSRWQ
jgi:hypothetical protein